MARLELNVDLNRVEGDLEIGLVREDGIVVEARTIGTMYRGFEQILLGRAPRDALVLTPRVCGICGTAHLFAAVTALEHLAATPVPPNATRIRKPLPDRRGHPERSAPDLPVLRPRLL